MLQRQTVGEVLERVRAKRGDSPQFQRAAEFIQTALARPEICWDDLVVEFRQHYKDAIDEIVAILMETDDPLIIFHTLRVLDPKDPVEAKAISDIVRDLDPVKHEVGMLGLLGEPNLRAAFKKKKDLPDSVRAALAPPAEEEAEEQEEEEEAKSSAKSSKSSSSRKKKKKGESE